MIQTQGLTHIHLVVRDLERSLRFYRDVFGLEERFRDGPKMMFLNTPGSQDLITLQRGSRRGTSRWRERRRGALRVSPGQLRRSRQRHRGG